MQYPHRQDGIVGLGLAIATVCAALPSLLQELASAEGQRLVTLRALDPARDHRYSIRDPAADPPKFWPQRAKDPGYLPQRLHPVADADPNPLSRALLEERESER